MTKTVEVDNLVAEVASSPDTIVRSPTLPQKLSVIVQNLATLMLLLVVLPINLLVVGVALVVRMFKSPASDQAIATNRQNILISGGKMTKALLLARRFHAAGHRVILIESQKYWLTGHRFRRQSVSFILFPLQKKSPSLHHDVIRYRQERKD